MNVFKFGGASIETVERAKHVVEIARQHQEGGLLLVISAKGKTTNALEKIVKEFYGGARDKALELYRELCDDHNAYARELLGEKSSGILQQLQPYYVEIEWIIQSEPVRSFDYYYDQVVCVGELLSTLIIAAWCNRDEACCTWIDVRDIIKTDANYRDANLNWQATQEHVTGVLKPMLDKGGMVITQGFIGSTSDNDSVTLGREGSDYTAAILANMLEAKSVTIWKDVPSLLNADPKIFPNTVPIHEISFHEVIEMAYYGAQVIHPKTIKPLQNKNIPLYVKCFLDPSLPGTYIHGGTVTSRYPCILVLKTNQVLLEVTTRDYSFITEDNLSTIYRMFHECRIKVNLIQNAAISFVACVDAHASNLDLLLQMLNECYEVKRNEDLFLFTARHYRQDILKEELKNRTVLLTQKTRQTIQMVVK